MEVRCWWQCRLCLASSSLDSSLTSLELVGASASQALSMGVTLERSPALVLSLWCRREPLWSSCIGLMQGDDLEAAPVECICNIKLFVRIPVTIPRGRPRGLQAALGRSLQVFRPLQGGDLSSQVLDVSDE